MPRREALRGAARHAARSVTKGIFRTQPRCALFCAPPTDRDGSVPRVRCAPHGTHARVRVGARTEGDVPQRPSLARSAVAACPRRSHCVALSALRGILRSAGLAAACGHEAIRRNFASSMGELGAMAAVVVSDWFDYWHWQGWWLGWWGLPPPTEADTPGDDSPMRGDVVLGGGGAVKQAVFGWPGHVVLLGMLALLAAAACYVAWRVGAIDMLLRADLGRAEGGDSNLSKNSTLSALFHRSSADSGDVIPPAIDRRTGGGDVRSVYRDGEGWAGSAVRFGTYPGREGAQTGVGDTDIHHDEMLNVAESEHSQAALMDVILKCGVHEAVARVNRRLPWRGCNVVATNKVLCIHTEPEDFATAVLKVRVAMGAKVASDRACVPAGHAPACHRSLADSPAPALAMVRAQARALSIGEPLMCTEDERVLIEVRLASVLSVDLFSAKLFPGGCAPNVAGVRLVVANARAEAIDIEIGFVGNRLPPRRAFRILKKAWSKLHTAAAKKRRDERESRDKRRRRGRGRAQAAVGGAAAAGAAALGRAASKPAHLLADEVRGVKHAIGAVERAMSAQFDVNFGEESGTDGAALGAGDEGEAGEADGQRALSKAAVAAADLRSRLRRGSVITMRPSELKPVLCAPRAVDIRARDNQAALSTFFAAAFAGPRSQGTMTTSRSSTCVGRVGSGKTTRTTRSTRHTWNRSSPRRATSHLRQRLHVRC